MGIDLYRTAQKRTATPTQTEYQVLADVTGRLLSIQDVKDPEATRILRDNIQVWHTFADDLMQDGNALPNALKAQLISLALWVGKHSRKVMRGHADVAPLIDVNKAIMSGLSQQARAAQPTPPAASRGQAGPAPGAVETIAALRRSA